MEIPCAASCTPIRKLIRCLFLLFAAAAAASVGKPLIESASSEGAGGNFEIICTQIKWKSSNDRSPERLCDLCREEAINQWVCCGIERCEALNERCHGDVRLSLRNLIENLKQVEDDVWRPAGDENNDNDEGHLHRLHLGTWNDAAGTRPPTSTVFLLELAVLHPVAGPVRWPQVRPLLPDRLDDYRVAQRDDERGYDEENHRHQCHVELPAPWLAQLDPALRSTFSGRGYKNAQIKVVQHKTLLNRNLQIKSSSSSFTLNESFFVEQKLWRGK